VHMFSPGCAGRRPLVRDSGDGLHVLSYAQSRLRAAAGDQVARVSRDIWLPMPLAAEDLTRWAAFADRAPTRLGPQRDLARDTALLTEMAAAADADTVFLDSVKDAAIKLTDDEVGAGFNQAVQRALVRGVEVAGLHHHVKRGTDGKTPPNTLAHVYGSTWITAGAGSVIGLWGAAGDPVVSLHHLKQPAEAVGPLQLIHDHPAGTTDIYREADLLQLARYNSAHGGLTAQAAASAMHQRRSGGSARQTHPRPYSKVGTGCSGRHGRRGGSHSAPVIRPARRPLDPGSGSDHAVPTALRRPDRRREALHPPDRPRRLRDHGAQRRGHGRAGAAAKPPRARAGRSLAGRPRRWWRRSAWKSRQAVEEGEPGEVRGTAMTRVNGGCAPWSARTIRTGTVRRPDRRRTRSRSPSPGQCRTCRRRCPLWMTTAVRCRRTP
jgi:hypothetical protein